MGTAQTLNFKSCTSSRGSVLCPAISGGSGLGMYRVQGLPEPQKHVNNNPKDLHTAQKVIILRTLGVPLRYFEGESY